MTAVWVPDAAHEAMRDLVRALRLRCEWQARHASIFRVSCCATAGRACLRWLKMVRVTYPGQQIVLQDYIDAVADAEGRVERLTGQTADLLPV